jgi:hypothetical protein
VTDKVEFASESWINLAARVLDDVVSEARDAISGQRLCVSEVFVDPPAHLRNTGSNEVAWSFEIANGRTSVARRELAHADYSVRADYQFALAGARVILGTSPAAIEARTRARDEAIASGRIMTTGSLDVASPAMRVMLIHLHNRLAARTA